MSTHTETLLKHTEAYPDLSTPCVTLAYSQPCHILSPTIFEALIRHIQNPHHWALFSNIQTYLEACATFAYAETWHTRNPGICRPLP